MASRWNIPCVLLGSILVGSLGCSDPGCPDPNDVALEVGTGATEFEPVGADGVLVVKGSQGGYHIWISLRTSGLGPRITVKLGVFDTQTSEVLSFDDIQGVIQVAEDGQGTAEYAGLRGFLKEEVIPTLPGRNVTLSVTASDDCEVPITGEAPTFVSDTPPAGGWPGAPP